MAVLAVLAAVKRLLRGDHFIAVEAFGLHFAVGLDFHFAVDAFDFDFAVVFCCKVFSSL